MNDDERERLIAQRDGWRAVAVRLLQGDFGDTPPVEFLPETFPLPFDTNDRSLELVDELKRRAYLTEVEASQSETTDPVVHIEATLGANARIIINRRPSVSDAFKFAVYHYGRPDAEGWNTRDVTLVSNREVSFELLLRYLDLIIAGYKAKEYDNAP